MRKIVDDKGRFFGVISIIDIIVVAVVAVLAIAVLVRLNVFGGFSASADTIDVTYELRVMYVRDKPSTLLRAGDKLYDDNDVCFGTIKSVSRTQAKTLDTLVDGRMVLSPVEERYDLLITVEVPCSQSNGRYYIERSLQLNANDEYWLHTKYNFIGGTIMSVSAAVPQQS